MTQASRDIVYALNLWIRNYNLCVEKKGLNGKPTLFLIVDIHKNDAYARGRLEITSNFVDMLTHLKIPKDDIAVAFTSDLSFKLNEKMFSLMCKSPYFKPEIIDRESFKRSHTHDVLRKYETFIGTHYFMGKNDYYNSDECKKACEKGVGHIYNDLLQTYPLLKGTYDRIQKQGAVYCKIVNTLFDKIINESQPKKLHRFMRLHGLLPLSNLDDDAIINLWQLFCGENNDDDWQCLTMPL